MKKIVALALAVVLSLCMTCSCTPKPPMSVSSNVSNSELSQPSTDISSATSSPSQKPISEEVKAAYEEFLQGRTPYTSSETYGYWDMNSDGIHELLMWTDYVLYIYTYKEGAVKSITAKGYNSKNDSVKILENNAIFVEHSSAGTYYTYVTFDDYNNSNEIEFSFVEQSKVETHYIFEGEFVSKREWDKLTKEYFESARLPEAPIDWNMTLGARYCQAEEAYKKDPKIHRDIGDFQEETEEIIEIEGRYFQSYVDEAADKRYVYLSFYEYDMSRGWNWVCIGTAKNYSLLLLYKEEEAVG